MLPSKSTQKQLADFFNCIHFWLIKYRVLAIVVTGYSGILLWDAWQFYKLHYREFEEFGSAAGIGVFILAFIGLVKWSFENVIRKHEGHGE